MVKKIEGQNRSHIIFGIRHVQFIDVSVSSNLKDAHESNVERTCTDEF